MEASVREILDSYDAKAPLENAWTIPAPWYVDERIAELERSTVFSNTWQLIGRTDQLAQPGQYVTAVLAGEPIVVVRGDDGALRGFFNVCRHHAASVMTEPEGKAPLLRCPYHGWTYSLSGELKGTPDFAGVCDFDKGRERARSGRDGGLGEVRLRAADAGRSVPRAVARASRRPVREARSLAFPLRRAPPLDLRVQLEGLRRQLPRRRLSRAAPPQGALVRPRLQRLHDRDGRPLVPSVEPDRPLERRGLGRRRPPGRQGPLLLDLAELHDQLVRGRHGHEPGAPARCRPSRGHLRLLLHRRRDSARRSLATGPRSTSATASRTRISPSATPSSAAWARAPTRPGVSPCAARAESSCSTASSRRS